MLVFLLIIGGLIWYFIKGKNGTPPLPGFPSFNPSGNTTPTEPTNTNIGGGGVKKLIKITDRPVAGAGSVFELAVKIITPPKNNKTNKTTNKTTDTKNTTTNNSVGTSTSGSLYGTTPTTGTSTTPTASAPAPETTPITPDKVLIRYVERATGNVFESPVPDVVETRLSSTRIPQIHDALFGNGGKSVVLRYVKEDNQTIETFAGQVPATPEGEMQGVFFNENITNMTVSPDSSRLFYLFNFDTGATGTTSGFAGDNKFQLFDMPYTEWLSQWINTKNILLTTKASGLASGYAYSVDSTSGVFNKVLGNINGLTTLGSPDGKWILYNSYEGQSLSLGLYNTEEKSLKPYAIGDLPEKCAFTADSLYIYCGAPKKIPGGLYPDDWYQGSVLFTDSVIRFNITTGGVESVADVSMIAGVDIDVYKPFIDPTGQYFVFEDKHNYSLWALALQ